MITTYQIPCDLLESVVARLEAGNTNNDDLVQASNRILAHKLELLMKTQDAVHSAEAADRLSESERSLKLKLLKETKAWSLRSEVG